MLISGDTRRHRRVAAHVDQARGHAVGARPRRDAADAGAERPARPHPRRDRRQLKTGRDVAIAALLGAEEFGFAHGGAGRERLHHDARLPPQHLPGRRRDAGSRAAQAVHGPARARHPLHAASSPRSCARSWRSSASARSTRWSAASTCSTPTRDRALEGEGPRPLRAPAQAGRAARDRRCTAARRRTTASTKALDNKLIELAQPALERSEPVDDRAADPQREPHRRHDAVGRRSRGGTATEGLPADTITLHFTRLGGPELRRVPARSGITLAVEGDANDYFGKGLSGGRIVVPCPTGATLRPRGEHHRRQRRALRRDRRRGVLPGRRRRALRVRNSGATAVVEGVGDHGCEYMTRGLVVVLGKTGRNFAAGMSGGVAYVLDEDGEFDAPLQHGAWSTSSRSTEDDVAILQRMIAAPLRVHAAASARTTCSRKWNTVAPQFVKVIPRDYKRCCRASTSTPETRHRLTRLRGWSGHGKITGFSSTSARGRRSARSRSGSRTGAIVEQDFPVEQSREQAARCMDCGIPFCHTGCPLGNIIPDWNDLVYRDRWEDALVAPALDQQLPGVHRAVCPAPCEEACVLNINQRAGHHQADREADRRPRLRGGLGRAGAARAAHRAHGRGRRLGPGGPRRARSS